MEATKSRSMRISPLGILVTLNGAMVLGSVAILFLAIPAVANVLIPALLLLIGIANVTLARRIEGRSLHGKREPEAGEAAEQQSVSTLDQSVDSLTGLANRQELSRVMETVRVGNYAGPLSVILVDLDNLKEINDTQGHLAGDNLLKEVGQVLARQSTGMLTVAKYGGDEFTILAPIDQKQAKAMAEFLRNEISLIEGPWGSITASFGVATTVAPCEPRELVEAADKALYAAKSDGKNRVVTDRSWTEQLAAQNKDELLADFENRIRTYADRMLVGMIGRAKELATTLRDAADHDQLTGLFNRHYLDRVLSREFEKCRQHNHALSVALIDLDNFGRVNKERGFTNGDRLLAGAASTIKESIRANDWVARYGGEEFLVVMPDTEVDAARTVAARIAGAIRGATIAAYDGTALSATGSIGVAQYESSDESTEALVARASDRVREAKTEGKDRVK